MGGPSSKVCAVCVDGSVARVLCAEGFAVVLFGPEPGALGHLAAVLRAVGPGRVALFAGDPADAADRAAALAMAEEQFGAVAVLVSSPPDARAMLVGGGVTRLPCP